MPPGVCSTHTHMQRPAGEGRKKQAQIQNPPVHETVGRPDQRSQRYKRYQFCIDCCPPPHLGQPVGPRQRALQQDARLQAPLPHPLLRLHRRRLAPLAGGALLQPRQRRGLVLQARVVCLLCVWVGGWD